MNCTAGITQVRVVRPRFLRQLKRVHKLVKRAIHIAFGSRLFCLILGFETLDVFTRFIRCKEALWGKSNRGSLRTAWSSLLHQYSRPPSASAIQYPPCSTSSLANCHTDLISLSNSIGRTSACLSDVCRSTQ
jgi:hypothetical protein